ncbi:hypothetical protein K501DRAFT_269788 [Backusella circina FSU 941]|nr:hypothetical protein K501DRAFT_269788 [Backusella circina FSU 941]
MQIYNTWRNCFVLSLRTHEKFPLILENNTAILQTCLRLCESDGTPKSSLFLLSTRQLLKEKISVEEETLLALSLSVIYNYFNLFTKAFYTPNILDDANHITTEPLDSSLTALLNNIISKSSIDDILGYIQTEKANLSQNKKRQTDAYVILSISEKIFFVYFGCQVHELRRRPFNGPLKKGCTERY